MKIIKNIKIKNKIINNKIINNNASNNVSARFFSLFFTVLSAVLLMACAGFENESGNKSGAAGSKVAGKGDAGHASSVSGVANIEGFSPISIPDGVYGFDLEEVNVELPDLDRNYRFVWVSDLHIVADHGEYNGVEAVHADKLMERYEAFKTPGEGIYSEDLWPDIVEFICANEFDGVLFGGDILDYASPKGLEKLKEGYDRIAAKHGILYIRADHDYGPWYTPEDWTENISWEKHKEIGGDDWIEKAMEFDDFIIVGVNNSTKDINSVWGNQIDRLEEYYDLGKPVIAMTHVPYEPRVEEYRESLEKFSMEYSNMILYWGGGQYIPNETTRRYLDLIYRGDSVCKQVIAGHIHAPWDGMITDEVPQKIFAPAFQGSLGIINVVKKPE